MEAPESLDEMERRHRGELRDLEGRVRAMLKGVKSKTAKAEIEAKGIQMEYDLKAKHREEIEESEELIEKMGGLETVFTESVVTSSAAEEEAAIKAKEEAEIAARRAKAQKKKDKSKAKDAEREAKKEEIANNAGPSMRQIELDAINKSLQKEDLKVKEIISDGNCLYRAFADQLQFSCGEYQNFAALRRTAAEYMTSHPEEFAAFMGCDGDSDEYKEYVAKVAQSAGDVEWGGQMEIRALCCALHKTALIYDANAPVLVMGEDFRVAGKELRLTYHRHYFSLGEHYNSVQSAASAEP